MKHKTGQIYLDKHGDPCMLCRATDGKYYLVGLVESPVVFGKAGTFWWDFHVSSNPETVINAAGATLLADALVFDKEDRTVKLAGVVDRPKPGDVYSSCFGPERKVIVIKDEDRYGLVITEGVGAGRYYTFPVASLEDITDTLLTWQKLALDK